MMGGLGVTLPVGMFKKRKALSCRCRHHAPGRPKIVCSLCHGWSGYHPAVIERITGKRLVRMWKSSPEDAEER